MKIELIGIEGMPDVAPGDDVASLIADAASGENALQGGDVVVVTQKIVSKAEGRLVPLSDVAPSVFAHQWGARYQCDPRVVELVLRESRRIVRMDRGVLIAETHHGFVCANAGVDLSNVDGGKTATLLPEDPDASAQRIREGLLARTKRTVAVIISDTFGRPWREGLVNIALGTAGISPLKSHVGTRDSQGFPLQASIAALADEAAAAAGLVSGKLNRVPVVLVRGLAFDGGGSGRDLLRRPEGDMFR
jgi:coenzyme F420-0:L-glutamate ligase/coenzyme F420-1:gamma-L-glutamate ligase